MACANVVSSPRYGRDGDAVAGACVGAGEGPAAQTARTRPSVGIAPSMFSRALPVGELAHVEVAGLPVDALRRLPAEEDVARRLHQALSVDHALALVLERVPAA